MEASLSPSTPRYHSATSKPSTSRWKIDVTLRIAMVERNRTGRGVCKNTSGWKSTRRKRKQSFNKRSSPASSRRLSRPITTPRLSLVPTRPRQGMSPLNPPVTRDIPLVSRAPLVFSYRTIVSPPFPYSHNAPTLSAGPPLPPPPLRGTTWSKRTHRRPRHRSRTRHVGGKGR